MKFRKLFDEFKLISPSIKILKNKSKVVGHSDSVNILRLMIRIKLNITNVIPRVYLLLSL